MLTFRRDNGAFFLDLLVVERVKEEMQLLSHIREETWGEREGERERETAGKPSSSLFPSSSSLPSLSPPFSLKVIILSIKEDG